MSQLKVNSIVPVGGLPSGANGGILQVVQAVKVDQASFNSTSFADVSGLSASITPSSSSSKILCTCSLYVSRDDGGSTTKINFVRGSTNIGQPTGSSTTHQATMFMYTTSELMFPITQVFLDSPATTSATTYKIQIGQDSTTKTTYINRWWNGNSYHGISTLTLYEVTA
jgi:hypothetical protein